MKAVATILTAIAVLGLMSSTSQALLVTHSTDGTLFFDDMEGNVISAEIGTWAHPLAGPVGMTNGAVFAGGPTAAANGNDYQYNTRPAGGESQAYFTHTVTSGTVHFEFYYYWISGDFPNILIGVDAGDRSDLDAANIIMDLHQYSGSNFKDDFHNTDGEFDVAQKKDQWILIDIWIDLDARTKQIAIDGVASSVESFDQGGTPAADIARISFRNEVNGHVLIDAVTTVAPPPPPVGSFRVTSSTHGRVFVDDMEGDVISAEVGSWSHTAGYAVGMTNGPAFGGGPWVAASGTDYQYATRGIAGESHANFTHTLTSGTVHFEFAYYWIDGDWPNIYIGDDDGDRMDDDAANFIMDLHQWAGANFQDDFQNADGEFDVAQKKDQWILIDIWIDLDARTKQIAIDGVASSVESFDQPGTPAADIARIGFRNEVSGHTLIDAAPPLPIGSLILVQ